MPKICSCQKKAVTLRGKIYMIKLSIITINYNDAAGLRKTLDSVAAQTYPYIQHIIVDGGSMDGSVEIIREYADNPAAMGNGQWAIDSDTNRQSPIANRQIKWITEPDKGIYNAMNKGIEIALGRRVVNSFNRSELVEDKNKGIEIALGRREVREDHASLPIANGQWPIAQTDYIQILNAGDILAAPDVTERMVNALLEVKGNEEVKGERLKAKGSENGEADTPASHLSPLASKLTSDSAPVSRLIALSPDRLENCPVIFYGNMIKEYPDGHRVKDTCGGADYTPESFLYFYKGTLNHDCVYIRKDLFEKYGLYNEQMKICSDWEWYVRAIALGGEKTVYTNIDVTIFDMTGISESDGKNKDIILKERQEYLESILPRTILHDYDRYSLPIMQYLRLKKYHLWSIVHFMERLLFQLEKWNLLR